MIDISLQTKTWLPIGNLTGLATLFQPNKVFDRVTIELNGGILTLVTGLQIYYAHASGMGYITTCAKVPNNPLAYYPLDGKSKCSIS